MGRSAFRGSAAPYLVAAAGGEQEHVNDVQRACDICYGLIRAQASTESMMALTGIGVQGGYHPILGGGRTTALRRRPPQRPPWRPTDVTPSTDAQVERRDRLGACSMSTAELRTR